MTDPTSYEPCAHSVTRANPDCSYCLRYLLAGAEATITDLRRQLQAAQDVIKRSIDLLSIGEDDTDNEALNLLSTWEAQHDR